MANYVYTSETMTSLRRAILENIQLHRGERNIIIVPDQFSLTIEREVLDILNCDCCFDIEVVSFSRYAEKVIHKSGNVLNKQTSVMLLSRVIIECIEKLVYYKKAALHKGFAEEIYAVITNFRNSGVSVKKLENAVNNLNGFMRNKLSDILVLYRGYIAALSEYSDMTTMLELLRDKLQKDTDVVGTNYYISDFYDMAQVKYEIVEVLAQRAKNVYMGFINCHGRNSHIYNKKFVAKILSFANVNQDEIVNVDSGLDEEKTFIKENIFAYGINCLQFGSNNVHIFEAHNLENEIEYAAMSIRRQIICDNKRYRDIAVALPEIDSYSEMIKRVFDRYEIPYFIDEKYPLMQHTCYKTLKLAVAALSMKQQDVINLIKEKGFGLSDSAQQEFENYLLKNNITGDNFNKHFGNEIAENVRVRVIDALKILKSRKAIALDKRDFVTASELVDNIKQFYKHIDIASFLQSIGGKSNELQRSINTQVMDKITDVIADMEALFGDLCAPEEIYYNVLFNGLESVKFSTIPLFIDCVFVGDSSDSRFGDMDTLYLIGTNEGAYPVTSPGKGIIRDLECAVLEKFGIEAQTALDRNNAHKTVLLQLIIKPRQLVVIAKSSGFDSLLKLQLQALFMLTPIKISPLIEDHMSNSKDIAFAASTAKNLELAMANGTISYANRDISNAIQTSSDEYACNIGDIAFFNNSISASGIEKFYTCPYMFYCEKVLRLKEREIAGEKANDIGTLMHEVLEKFYGGKYYETCDDIGNAVRGIVDECFKDEKYAMLLNSGGRAVRAAMTGRAIKIVKSIDSNRINSEFVPQYFEYEFGVGKQNNGLDISIGNKQYNIGGFIDRIDICGDNMVVFDYKSSKKEIDDKTVKRGSMLQLPLYTNIAARNLSKKPIAMLYVTMPGKYVKNSDSTVAAKCTGFVLDDTNETIKLDKHDADYTGGYLPPYNKYDKNGLLKGKKYRIMQQDFEYYAKIALRLIIQAVELCETHELSPTPIKDACDYCKYSSVCQKSNDPSITREK